jgi:phage shock protein PspC (stress-responsive transcriptional regulator)
LVTETNRTQNPSDPAGDAYWHRLQRLDDGRTIGGVATGLSAWLGVPVIAVRLVFVIAALLNGIGLLAYAALWLALPLDGDHGSAPSRSRVIVGVVLGGLAALLILERFDLPTSGILLPLLLVGVGVALWQRSPDRRPRPTAPAAPLPEARTEDTSRVRRVRRSLAHPPRRSASQLTRIGLALAFAALAIALLVDRGDALDLTLSRGTSLLLVVLGAVLIVGAWFGHARPIVALALPLAVFLPVASTFDSLDVDPFTHLGDRAYFADGSATPLAPSYRNGIGTLELNFGNIVPDGAARRTELRNAMGTTEVFAPPRVEVIIHARAGWGTITVDDLQRESTTSSFARWVRLADEEGRDVEQTITLPGEAGGGSIEIDITNGFGTIRVTRVPSDHIDRFPFTTRPAPPATTATTVPPATTAGTAPTSPPASTVPASTESR